jgi:glycosyltransferase involved in cell wall biosynthesis
MIQKQTYKHYQHVIVDDASTDNTYNTLISLSDEKTTIFKNNNNLGWVHNSMKYLATSDNDIVVIVDLDDWLIHDHVLEILNNMYNENNCWITYGSFVWFKEKVVEGRSYPTSVIRNKTFREYDWLAVHPQTFKGFLFKNIDPEDFKYRGGDYLRSCYDQALMMPILEMCPSDKIKFIKEPLYVYNDINPLNLMKVKKQYQIDCSTYIRSLKKYKELEYEGSTPNSSTK